MNDSNLLFDVIILVVLGVIPLFAGALKGYSASGIIRILARFAAPTVSAVAITFVVLYHHSLLLFPLETIFDGNNGINQEYAIIPIAISFVVLLWFLFFKLVSFGESIGQEEDAGLRTDGTKIAKQVNTIITPTLDEFAEKMQDRTEEKLENFAMKLTDTIIPEIKKITENQQNIQDKISQFNINEEQRATHQKIQDEKIDQLIESQQKQNDILKTVQQWFAQNPNQYEILLSQTEALNAQNKKISDSDNDVRNIPDDDSLQMTQTQRLF